MTSFSSDEKKLKLMRECSKRNLWSVALVSSTASSWVNHWFILGRRCKKVTNKQQTRLRAAARSSPLVEACTATNQPLIYPSNHLMSYRNKTTRQKKLSLTWHKTSSSHKNKTKEKTTRCRVSVYCLPAYCSRDWTSVRRRRIGQKKLQQQRESKKKNE